MSGQPRRLNLGCGPTKKEGFLNVDWSPAVHPDLVHDLNSIPYPFEDNCFECVEADHVLEHLDRPFQVMRELHRILKPGGRLRIKVPHFTRGFTHAEHSHGFDVTFPSYFNRHFPLSVYSGIDYTLTRMRLKWLGCAYLLKFHGFGFCTCAALAVLNRVFSFLANLSPALCSRVWCYWVGGFDEIEFEFLAEK